MKLAGVVVLYNPSQDVIKNIHSYLPCLEKLYLVDNSIENNVNMFNGLDDICEYIPLLENMGIAYALNVGAKRAIDEGYDYLLTMDQDSCFENRNLNKMIQIIEDDSDISNVGIYAPFHKTAISGDIPNELFSNPLVVMTSGNIIDLSAYTDVDGFKEWMFIDCVDFEYGLNLRMHGYDIKQINTVFLEHELGDYEIKHFFNKSVFCDNHSALRRYYIIRNSLA